MNKLYLGIASLGLLGFLYAAYTLTNTPVQTHFPEVAKIVKQSSSAAIADHTRGTGKNILVEYADLQCPSCKSFSEFLSAEMKKDAKFKSHFDTNFTFVYRNYPLENIHKNALIAAKSAEAVGLQGKFFEFVELAFANQSVWSESTDPVSEFTKYIKDLGLSEDQFRRDLDSKAVKAKIDADVASGIKAQLQGTPTLYLNGKKMSYASFEEFKKQIMDVK